MNFLTLNQANAEPYQREYRYRLWTALLALVAFDLCVAGFMMLVYFAWRQQSWVGVVIGGWCALWFALFAWMAWSVFKARRLSSNWLLRIQGAGILLKFRSYLNHNFPSEDMVVVSISFSEIESAAEHRMQRNIPGRTRGDDTVQRLKYAELKLRPGRIGELETQLIAERGRWFVSRKKWQGRRRTQHYPVQTVAGDVVRIEWSVAPRVKQFLADIQEFVRIEQPTGSNIDFRNANVSKVQLETQLLELIQSGDKIGAIRVARLLYRFDLTQAVNFVDEFSEGKGR